MKDLPLIAPTHFSAMSFTAFRNYIKGIKTEFVREQAEMRAAKAGKPTGPVKGVSFRVNDKGTPIITIRDRKPKWLAPYEIDSMADFYGVSKQEMWKIVASKKIKIERNRLAVEL